MHHLKSFRLFGLLYFVVFIGVTTGCGGLATSSSLDGDSGDSGDSGGSYDELDSTESGLYGDGPIDLPVTIAKLDSADAQLLTIEYSDSLSQQLTHEAPSYQTAGDGGYEIMGDAGAVDLDQATKLFALNTATAESTIVDVADDGSFELQIAAEEGQVIALAPMVDAEDQIGIPLFVDEENGVDTIALTNSDNLNPNVNLEVNVDGYLFFSAEVADGTFEIYRRNLDGTPLETVATGITSQVRFIAMDDQGSINYVTQDGKVFSILQAATSSAFLTYDDPFELMSFGDVLDDADTFVPAPAEVFRVSSGTYMGKVFVSNKRQVNSGSGGLVQPSFLRFINISNGTTTTELLDTDDYSAAEFSLSGLDDLFVAAEVKDAAAIGGGRAFELYELDMTLGPDAWASRTLAYTHTSDADAIVSLRSTRHSLAVFVVQNAATGIYAFYSLAEGGTPTLLAQSPSGDKTYSEWVALTEHNPVEQTSLVTCATDASEGVSYLVWHRLGIDAPGEFYRLTSTVNKDGCQGNYAIDNQNRVLFYRSETIDGVEQAPQISFIDLDDLDADELFLDE